jgi:hypothetical protein
MTRTLLLMSSDWKRRARKAIQFGLIDFGLDQVTRNSMHIISIYHSAIPISG